MKQKNNGSIVTTIRLDKGIFDSLQKVSDKLGVKISVTEHIRKGISMWIDKNLGEK